MDHTNGEGSTVQLQQGNTEVEDVELLFNATKDIILGMQFDTLEDAQHFYKEYALVKGFGMRLDDIYRNKHGEPYARRMVCSAEGKRDNKYIEDPERMREHRPLTRFGCPAGMRVRKNKGTGRWEVFRFDDDHNHPTLGPKHIPLHRCHRKMTDADIAQVDTMHSYGIKGSQIYGYIAGQSGGHEKSGFSRKDMYNHINRERNLQISDGDAMAALHYLEGKADGDPMFFMKYTIDRDGRLENLFWADGNSRIDYKCFGDVLAFDSTYKKNKYNKPIVIFSGVNHHKNTVLFGCAIIANETEQTYMWLLTTLIEAMDGRQPVSVITDSDKAMRNAIKSVLPQCCHRLCAWHLERNATTNIANPQFTKAFRDCLFGDLTVAQFESKWNAMIQQFEVGENQWVKKMYKKRMMWAAAYLRGKLFVGLRTTSQCEGMNSYIKKFVNHSHNLVEFIHHFQRCLNYFRYNELIADFKSMHGDVVLTTSLDTIERSGAQLYTREAFWIFRREIKMAAACVMANNCKQHITTKTYEVQKFMNPNNVWFVHIDKQEEIRIKCECGKLQSFGIPCQHIIFVLVQEGIPTLPPCLIVQRWTKTAKDVDGPLLQNEVEIDKLANFRFGSLIQDCRMMCKLGSTSTDSFQHVRDNVRKIIKDLQEQSTNMGGQRNTNITHPPVLDPNIVRSKGRPASTNCLRRRRRRKRCSLCHVEGHTRVTCPLNREKHSTQGMAIGEGSRKSVPVIQEGSRSTEGISSEDDITYKLLNVHFCNNIMDNGSTDDADAEFYYMNSAPIEGEDADTGIWTIDGQLLVD